MKSARLAGALLLFLVPLAACSESDVQFPDAGAAGAAGAAGSGGSGGADAAPDTAAPDVRPDTGVTPDAPPDVSTDPRSDGDARVDTSTDPSVETASPDVVPDNHDVDVKVDSSDDATEDSVDAPGPDAQDAVSEDADTCESHCASGVCDSNGDCKPCVQDSECKGGRVCNVGTCGPKCGVDGGTTCSGTLTCCDSHCVDTTRDPQHCGMCSTTCSATQFCGNASTPTCKDNTISNVCNTKKATFLLDGLPDDDGSSDVIKVAIAAHCVPAPMSTSVDQAMSTSVNPVTGQPLAGGGELLVAAGGDSTQHLTYYLEKSGTSTIYNESDGSTFLRFLRRGGGADGGDTILIDEPYSTLSSAHDYFVVEVVKDPVSGALSLIVYGFESPGTKAGAWYFANQILPTVTTFTKSWYVYEWSASNADAGPGASDTFTERASGN